MALQSGRSFGALPPISAYVGELNQVWTNLIHNAIQAMDGRGEILIETKVEKGDVEVAIQDTGPGIEPEVAARIFEPFFTTKAKGEGTGLGLSISARIVEKHGGTIRVDSRPGRTRFEVKLPIDGPGGLDAAEQRDAGAHKLMPSETTPLRAHLREHILCVDDEEGILAALRQQLSARFGAECDIAVAKNAREALDLMEDLQQDGEQLAVVIADQIMPGMKGVELARGGASSQPAHGEDPADRAGRPRRGGLRHQQGRARSVHPQAVGRARPAADDPELPVALPAGARARRAARRAADEERRAGDAELVAGGEGRRRTKELENLNARLAELAITDGLTDLYNHRHFRERLSLEMERSNRTGLPLSVLMIDVDHFKGYNDRHGHLAGDNALRGVSKILQHGRRANDVVARYGGEEFAIILLDVGRGAAKDVAERICAQVAEFPFEFGSTQPSGKLTISVGVASFPDDGAEPALVLSAADRALFAAKNAGRNRVRVAGT